MKSTAEIIKVLLGVLGALSVFSDKAIFSPNFDPHGYRMLSRVKSSIVLNRGTKIPHHVKIP